MIISHISWPQGLVQRWYCKEKLHGSHSYGLKSKWQPQMGAIPFPSFSTLLRRSQGGWLGTSQVELDNAHWTHGSIMAWPYMYFSFSVWEATTVIIAMPRWCGLTGPEQMYMAVTWMGYFCFKGYLFFQKRCGPCNTTVTAQTCILWLQIQFTAVPFIQFLPVFQLQNQNEI